MRLSVDPDSQVPLHAQVADLLRSMIRKQEYRNGKLLPAETELAMHLGISRNTLRAGMEKLVSEGLLVRKAGHGTRVAPARARTSRMESWESFTREMAAQGIAVQDFASRYELRRAPAVVLETFALSRGTPVLALERVRGFEDAPVVHFLSWFHPRLGLTGKELFDRPLYDVLEEACAVRPAHSHERITAVSAEKSMAGFLGVTIGMPLLRRERRVTDAGGRLIEFAVNHYRTDRFEYTVDIERTKA